MSRSESPGRRRAGPWRFFRRFLRNPSSIGAVVPSSPQLARRMVEPVRWNPGVRVVEFGPGTGPFTREIRRRLPPDGRYLGIELEPEFIEHLAHEFPGLTVAHDSVTNLLPLARAHELLPLHHIVSGLPFASLPDEVTRGTLDAVEAALDAGGTFTTFQYAHAIPLSKARRFRDEMARRFGPMVMRRFVLRNLPPAFVFTWRKGEVRTADRPRRRSPDAAS